MFTEKWSEGGMMSLVRGETGTLPKSLWTECTLEERRRISIVVKFLVAIERIFIAEDFSTSFSVTDQGRFHRGVLEHVLLKCAWGGRLVGTHRAN